eukprot:6200076-Pleurochrysis_carterae.AAC.1
MQLRAWIWRLPSASEVSLRWTEGARATQLLLVAAMLAAARRNCGQFLHYGDIGDAERFL